MAQNEIKEILDHLRRIKSGGNLDSIKIAQTEVLEIVVMYHNFLLPDSRDIIIQKANWIVKMHRWVLDRIPVPDECKTNLNLGRLFSHLFKFFEGKTNLSYNYELKDFDLSKYMDFLGKNLNDVLMILLEEEVRYDPPEENLEMHVFIKQLKIIQKKMKFLRYLYDTEITGFINHEKLECLETRIQFMANNVGQLCIAVSVILFSDFVDDTNEGEVDRYDMYKYYIFDKSPYVLCLIVLVELEMKKILLSELTASAFTQSRTFKGRKLPKGFSHHLHSLLICLRNKKLQNFPNDISAQNIDVAIEFLLVFLDADVSNHVIDDSWLNEVLLKVGPIVGDVLYVIQKLLPSSITNDDTSKVSFCSIQILEKTKNLKAQVKTYYKSLIFTPSQFPTFGGLSFLDSVLRKLNEMSKSKSGLDFLMKLLLCNLEKEISSLTSILQNELSSLSSIFRDVAKVHHEHKIPKDLQRRTINLAYEAEVAIDSILSQYNAFLHIFCSLPTILKEIKQINAEVTEMWSVGVALKAHYVAGPSKHLPTRHSNPVSDEEIVGFEIATEKLIQYLTRGTSELDVIPIVGMGGQGKTTCARKLYNNGIIVSRFDVRAWCIISQAYNRRELLQDIFSQVTGIKDKGDKDDVLSDMLRKHLIGKRYLIVLDDMWDGMSWDDLRLSFPDNGNRSRIVITTRLEKLSVQVKYHTDPYYLPFLTTEESFQLLQRKVFQPEVCPPELQNVSLAVAKRCKGLPLVVVLVAGIIKKRKLEESWCNEVKDALFDYLDRESEEYGLATMQLSFDYLPDYLKPCLLYMGMFPEDSRIPMSKLISLWIVEDFVENIETAEGYLMDLISSNMLMVSRRRYNGKVKYCQVHDVVLHFCLAKSKEENFMLAVKEHYIQFQPLDLKGSRVRFSFNEEHSKFTSLGSKTRKPFHQQLRSLLTTNKGNFVPLHQVSELRLLKVLDLSSHFVDFLSSATLKPLIHLKYLGVSSYEFDFHPESHLPHLETLIVKNNVNVVLLPPSFWEMEKLRHAEIADAKFDFEEYKDESSQLENLRILRHVRFPNEEVDRVDVLVRRFPNLQQLNVDIWNNAAPFCLTYENLTQLQIFRLSFRCNGQVFGLQLPSNLKKLVLTKIPIESGIPFIAGLPSLEYLQLRSLYFARSQKWCLGGITFHKLKFLKLVLLGISRWDASEESFPLLETLVIRGCYKLKEIPISFAEIPTLKQIKLIECNESLENSAVRIAEEVEAIEGCDRINLITIKDWSTRNIGLL